ncbi:hypothetical protein [Corynebacterium sp.]|uniref:hypothetical protein n=1 Tax=Corynebacterium sp. TaxID=1720 RepID=UPI0026DF5AFA|nr:hypothetical protein [Corynebacterium sp.]MDO5512337.1 hypothetical protein [Corynebacterium sp.]
MSNPGDNDDTRYLGPTGGDRPRQYFPGEHDPGYQPPRYDQPQYQPPVYEEPAPRASRSGGGALPLLMGILFGLTLIAAAVLFFLWRGAAAEAERPVEPVTVTETTSLTVTETTTERALPTELPTELPRELPSELPEVDIEGWLNDLLGSEPAQ